MTLEQRVRKLERENRWMRRIAGVAVAAVAVVVLVGQAKEEKLPDLVVRSLTVKDAKGRARSKLMAKESGAWFEMYDTDECARFIVCVSDKRDASYWALEQKGGGQRVTATQSGQVAELEVFGNDGFISISTEGKSHLAAKDYKGRDLWRAPRDK